MKEKEKIIERKIYTTPSGVETAIAICKCEDEKHRLVLGSNLMTSQEFNSFENAKRWLDVTDIEFLGSMITCFIDCHDQMKNHDKKELEKQNENTMSKPQREAD